MLPNYGLLLASVLFPTSITLDCQIKDRSNCVSLTVAHGKVSFFYETDWNPVSGRDCTTQNANIVVWTHHPMNIEIICPPLKAGHKVKGSVFISGTTIAC